MYKSYQLARMNVKMYSSGWGGGHVHSHMHESFGQYVGEPSLLVPYVLGNLIISIKYILHTLHVFNSTPPPSSSTPSRSTSRPGSSRL